MKMTMFSPVKEETASDRVIPISDWLVKFVREAMREANNEPVVVNKLFIPDAPTRWRSMIASIGLQVAITVFLVAVPILFPEKFAPVRQYLVTALAEPQPVAHWKPEHRRPVPLRTHEVVPELPPALEEPSPTPRIATPVPAGPVAKPVRTARKAPAIPDLSDVATEIVTPSPLPAPSLSIPTLKKPREGVQTGIFAGHDGSTDGDPNTGLTPGRGGVVSASFTEGVPGGVRGGTGHRAGVLEGSFVDDHGTATTPKPRDRKQAPLMTPVHITEKPKPLYTSEGRAKKIEGEVLLQVVFTASGEVQVLHVLKGLGYGLDESAQNAARQIKFNPAQKDGQAVDSSAVVHIVFELAS
jgi:TonB family protein